MHVLICGGGVIGASIAYFLSRRGVKATVIEPPVSPVRRPANRVVFWLSTGVTGPR